MPKIPQRNPSGLTVVGITCGIGSMLVGAKQAGFKVLGNVEWRPYYHHRDSLGGNTFEMNFPRAIFAKGLGELSEGDQRILSKPTLIMGHTECGNYSSLRKTVAHRSKRGIGEVKGDPGDIYQFIAAVSLLQPRYFVMDNLPGSLEAVSMEEWARLLPDYDLFPEFVGNYFYGNVQKNRNRLFIIGAKRSEGFVFYPGESPNKFKLSDIIGDLLGKEGTVTNHNPHCLNETTAKGRGLIGPKHMTYWEFSEWMKKQPDGYTLKYIKADGTMAAHPGVQTSYWNGHSTVLFGYFGGIHPLTGFPFTIRERARIQGFPDDFQFFGEVLNSQGEWNLLRNIKLVRQTGKAMPIQFCRFVSQQIAAHVLGKDFASTRERLAKPKEIVNDAKLWYCKNVGYKTKRACHACWLKDQCEVKTCRG